MSPVFSGRYRGLVVLAAILIAIPLVFSNPYHLDIAIRIGLSALVALGLNLLMGYAGQISLGHAGFFGIGAYASAILTARFAWPPVGAMLAGMAATCLLALLVARPILRLRGHFLAMATLGVGVIVSIVLTNESAFTGGPDGMTVPPFSVFGAELAGERAWYAVVAVLLFSATWLMLNLIDAPAGRALRAIRGSEISASVAGIDTTSYKIRAFVLSAATASMAGSLLAHYVGLITPASAGITHSIELVTMVVVGGMASVFGSLVGAMLLTLLPQFLSAFEGWETVVFGAVLILTMIFLPTGLVPALRARLFRRSRDASNI